MYRTIASYVGRVESNKVTISTKKKRKTTWDEKHDADHSRPLYSSSAIAHYCDPNNCPSILSKLRQCHACAIC